MIALPKSLAITAVVLYLTSSASLFAQQQGITPGMPEIGDVITQNSSLDRVVDQFGMAHYTICLAGDVEFTSVVKGKVEGAILCASDAKGTPTLRVPIWVTPGGRDGAIDNEVTVIRFSIGESLEQLAVLNLAVDTTIRTSYFGYKLPLTSSITKQNKAEEPTPNPPSD